MATEKTCSRCRVAKPFDQFAKQATGTYGLQCHCRDCKRILSAERYAANPQRANEVWRKSYQVNKDKWLARQKTPEVRAARNEGNKKRYPQTREARVQKLRERNASPEFKAKRHEYYKRNRAKYWIYKAESRARESNAEGTFTVQEWLDLCDKHDGKCLSCGEKKPLSVDHVIPLARGGSNYISNIQPLCKRCNQSKGVNTIDYRTNAV